MNRCTAQEETHQGGHNDQGESEATHQSTPLGTDTGDDDHNHRQDGVLLGREGECEDYAGETGALAQPSPDGEKCEG